MKQKYIHNIQVVRIAKASSKTQSFPLGTSSPFSKILSLHQIFIFWRLLSDGNGHMTKPESSQHLHDVKCHYFHQHLKLKLPLGYDDCESVLQFFSSKVTGSCKKLCLKKQGVCGLPQHLLLLHSFSFIPWVSSLQHAGSFIRLIIPDTPSLHLCRTWDK